MTPDLIAIVGAGALCAGFVSGLTGFGTGLVALGFWLHVMEPALAAPLVVICSVVAQTQSFAIVRRAIDWRRLWPFLAGGIVGVPLGVSALEYIDAQSLRSVVGGFLVFYAGSMLLSDRLPVIGRGGRGADGAVGFSGGILGGAAGLSGALPTVWCGLRGWSKDVQRAVYQPFNLAVLSWALIAQAGAGIMTAEVGRLTLICLPGTLLGAWLGVKAYGRIDDRQFRRIVLLLMLASGSVLTLSPLF